MLSERPVPRYDMLPLSNEHLGRDIVRLFTWIIPSSNASCRVNGYGDALGGLDDESTYASCSVGLQQVAPNVCRMQVVVG